VSTEGRLICETRRKGPNREGGAERGEMWGGRKGEVDRGIEGQTEQKIQAVNPRGGRGQVSEYISSR